MFAQLILVIKEGKGRERGRKEGREGRRQRGRADGKVESSFIKDTIEVKGNMSRKRRKAI